MKMTYTSTHTAPCRTIDELLNEDIESMNLKGWEVENIIFRYKNFNDMAAMIIYKKDTDPFKESNSVGE